MTGAYVRIKRGGEWCAVEIDRLTDEELDELERSAGSSPAEGWKWAKFLAKWIRETVDEL